MNLTEIYKPIASELAIVEERLPELARSRNENIAGAISQVLNAAGKRLRPALLLTAAKACNYVGDRAINLAAAVEMIHTASLIHDDIIDDAGLRRGVPTARAQWGNTVAVLAGDHLYTRAVKILATDGDLEVVRIFAATCSEMTESEATQSLDRTRQDLSEEGYLGIIAGKTAFLMSCACRVGGMLGDAHNGEANMLGEYGMNFGMAFQIADDLLDLTGEKKRLGKPPGNDLREGRMTLPIIRAMSVADRGEARRMKKTLQSRRVDAGLLARVREWVERHGGIEYSRLKVRQYADACKDGLKALHESESRNSLSRLADYVVARACRPAGSD